MSALAWQLALKNIIRDPKVLQERLSLDESWLLPAQQAARLFPLRVSESFVLRMQQGNPDDPLLRQILPIGEELQQSPLARPDPLEERNKNPIPGLLHKYKGRVLLITTSSCAVHCRYCFRRDFPYVENNPGKREWQQAFEYIASDPSIHEVILSGGDPLTLDDDYLAWFLEQLSPILHIKIIRIHTRLPIIIPERVTPELLNILTNTRLKSVMVIHCNHPQEIDENVQYVLQQAAKKITLLNQSVLLHGVNDDAETLIQLSEKLFAADVLPYYLHQLDPVQGAMHFNVTDVHAKALYQEIIARLPGYLVPKLVREVPGVAAKQAIGF